MLTLQGSKPPIDTWINLHFKGGLVRRAKLNVDGKYISTDSREWFSGYKVPDDVLYWDLVDNCAWYIRRKYLDSL